MDDSGTFGKKRLPAGFEVNDRRGGEEQLASDEMRALIKQILRELGGNISSILTEGPGSKGQTGGTGTTTDTRYKKNPR